MTVNAEISKCRHCIWWQTRTYCHRCQDRLRAERHIAKLFKKIAPCHQRHSKQYPNFSGFIIEINHPTLLHYVPVKDQSVGDT